MWPNTQLTERLGLRVPIIQAPMAGGPTTPELVAAVSNAGGLGTLAGGYLSAEQTRAAIRRVRALTDRPFGINLLVPQPVAHDAARIARAQSLLAPYREELQLGMPAEAGPDPYEEQLAIILEERVPVFSFTFALPAAEVLAEFKRRGVVVLGTATTVAEAVRLEASGVDMVVAQGGEAGGHRGTFLGSFEQALIGTIALVPAIVDAVRIPVVAAGGVMDGRGIAAALALGASGVQLGTAFLTADESGTSAPHRQALLESTEESTCVTRAFSGKPVRAIENRLIRDLRAHESELPGYPIQNALTRALRKKATALGRTDLMGMWAGQGTRLSRTGTAAAMMADWEAQVEAVLAGLCRPTV